MNEFYYYVNIKVIEDKEKWLNKLKKEYNNLKINQTEKDTNNKSYNTNYYTNTKKKLGIILFIIKMELIW